MTLQRRCPEHVSHRRQLQAGEINRVSTEARHEVRTRRASLWDEVGSHDLFPDEFCSSSYLLSARLSSLSRRTVDALQIKPNCHFITVLCAPLKGSSADQRGELKETSADPGSEAGTESIPRVL